MGEDVANVERYTHAQPGAVVSRDRWVRFHHGTGGVDEKQVDPSWWDQVRDAARGNSGPAWQTAVSTVAGTVSFSWTNDWSSALRRCFRD